MCEGGEGREGKREKERERARARKRERERKIKERDECVWEVCHNTVRVG